jgi:hypothetical protein
LKMRIIAYSMILQGSTRPMKNTGAMLRYAGGCQVIQWRPRGKRVNGRGDAFCGCPFPGKTVATVFVITGLCAAKVALGCPYSIRDAGFVVRDPKPYRLLVIVNNKTSQREQLAEWVSEASRLYLPGSNLEAGVVNVDSTRKDEVAQLILAHPPTHLPAVALVSPRDKLLYLPTAWQAGITREALLEIVRAVVVSPLRNEITRHLVLHWCVVVVAEGVKPAENAALFQMARAASRSVAGAMTEMGQRIDRAPYVLRLRVGDTEEKVLRWSIGLEEGDESRAAAVVLFGMGRRLGPVLPAEKTTQDLLARLFRLLGKNCTCTSDPRWILGPAIPTVWGSDMQTQVRDRLGFDPSNPSVLNSLAGAWILLRNPKADWSSPALEDFDEFAKSVPQDPSSGYTEFGIGQGSGESSDTEVDAVPTVDLRSADTSLERQAAQVVVMVVIGLAVVALLGSALIVLRQRRSV